MTHNARTVKTNFKRIELCDMMIACTMLAEATGAKKWEELHEKINKAIEAFDKDHEAELLAEIEAL